VQSCTRRGLAVVETAEARSRLESLLDMEPAKLGGSNMPSAVLSLVRLTRDEIGARCVPLAGPLYGTEPAAVRGAPKVSAEGVFAAFTVPKEAEGATWVPFPPWSAVLLARRPVALSVVDVAKVPALLQAACVTVRQ
jgi:hypothetical protein